LSRVSHTPETHARDPSVGVQVCPVTPVPLGSFGWQTPGPPNALHHCPDPHSASDWHAVVHAPVAVLQYGPACVPVVHIVSLVQVPQAPVALQYGLAAGQG
jgi:hypothetical protein